MIRVITFFTRGRPWDNALPLEMQMLSVKHLVEAQGHQFCAFSPDEVRRLGGGKLVSEYPDEFALPLNGGFNKMGFGAWKPFIILEALRDLGPEDAVVYMDCNFAKHGQIRDKASDIGAVVETARRIGDFFVPRESAGQFLKANEFSSHVQMREIGGDTAFCRSFPLLIAHTIVAVNSPQAKSILTEWLTYCSHPRFVLPPSPEERDPEFRHFCPEQSVLNQVIARRIQAGALPWWYPGVMMGRGLDVVVADNSHARLLSEGAAPVRLGEDSATASGLGADNLMRGRVTSSDPAWRRLDVALGEWSPDEGVALVREGEGVVIAGGAGGPGRLSLSREDCRRSRVRLTIVAEALPECDADLIVWHAGDRMVAIRKPDGAVHLGHAISAASSGYGDSLFTLQVEYVSLHPSLILGLGASGAGERDGGARKYRLHSVEIDRADL